MSAAARSAVADRPGGLSVDRASIAERIASIFADVLDRPGTAIDDDFFAIGGDSIQAVSVVLQIEEAFARSVPLAAMAEAATARALADFIVGNDIATPITLPGVVVPFRTAGSYTPLFFIHGGAGQVLNFRRLAEELGDEIPVYGLKTVYDDVVAPRPMLSMEQQSEIFARAIVQVQPHGPYCLGGYSFGGIAAYETAFRLIERGEQVALVAMVDSDVADAGTIVDYGDYAMRVIAQQRGHALDKDHETRALRQLVAMVRHGGRIVQSKVRQRLMRLLFPHFQRLGRPVPEWLFDVLRANQFAETAYAPRPSALPIRFFRVGEGRVRGQPVKTLGWQRIAPDSLKIHHVPGDHYLAMGDPTVGEIARYIAEEIRGIEAVSNRSLTAGETASMSSPGGARSSLFADLAWLPRPPADFRVRCAELNRKTGSIGSALRFLASHAVSGSDAEALADTLRDGLQSRRDVAPLAPLRLAILSNATTNYIAQALVAAALRHGVALEVIELPFGQVAQAALDPNSLLYTAKPDVVLLAVDYRGVKLHPTPGEREAADASIAEALAEFNQLRRAINQNCGATCIVQTLATPPEPLFGSFDTQVAGTARALISAFNRVLAESLIGSNDKLLDVTALAETVGLAAWFEPRQWTMARLPFAQSFVPLYAEHIGRLLGAMRGKSRRVLVLDLDNTLWGGVVGDDGVEGIVLGEGDPDGEAFAALQDAALALRGRGIVLAVCSKNDDSIARKAFREHPEMRLKEDDIAVFQANWSDKADNLRAIAEELSLGLDSFVFVDDNPAERARIREELPEVAVIELGSDPTQYARLLLASGYFEAVAFSDEDRQRAEFYRSNARRAALKSDVSDLSGYLQSLEMVITFAPFDEVGRSRIAQLINKSNQFNLTTRRYTEAEIAQMQVSPDYFTLQVRLADRFGDNGMISVVICRKSGAAWEIDTWLMSCRVLGRRVEEAVLQEIVFHARASDARELVGQYVPTERNALVEGHYAKLGFEPLNDGIKDPSCWRLALAKYQSPTLPMEIKRVGAR